MSKIKLRIVEFEGNQVVIQILEMDERFRRSINSKELNLFESKTGYIINSSHSPFFNNSKNIYLRGIGKNHDLSICTIEFDNKKEKETYLQDLKCSLIDWANNWEGFKENNQIKTDSSIDYIWEK
jgi:hypothetical protein